MTNDGKPSAAQTNLHEARPLFGSELKRGGAEGSYSVRAASDVEHRAITELVRRMYAGRGLSVHAVTSTDQTTTRTTLAACAGKHVMGTLSVALDTHEGLLADGLYKTEIDVFR